MSRRSGSFDPAAELSSGWVTRLARYWPLTIAFLILGAVGGHEAGDGTAAVYTAEEQIAVGYAQNNLSAGATAGYASAAAQLASNYARYVNDEYLAGTSAAGNVEVVGTAIDASNVIRIIATSTDPDAAVAGAAAAGDQLVKGINAGAAEATPEAIKASYDKAVNKWSTFNAAQVTAQAELSSAVGRAEDEATVGRLRDELADAQANYAKQEVVKNALAAQYQNVQVTGGASLLTVINPASGDNVTSDHRAKVVRYTLVGIGIGLVLALIAVSLVDVIRRRFSRSRRSSRSSGGLSEPTWSIR